ncbi:hypothetical protein K491DRAFT_707279 [Lophiostoma macrostomum CBS 122681]|uniref:Plus3 domain-containing protein n=1 Tax=Lophiostoma macrostomum CBS 122681 TaxID=1314788 RepID=A0A6A6STE8_9PLEO|nr:hypothetical protein K491DRAFT_707279 [Lophiostoma macrostomum CBS 122681]
MSDFDDELFALAGGDEDADVEEGEASSVAASSPNSLGSDAMDESDSEREDDVPAKDSDVPYPLEGKYMDAKDKQYINSLPQLERERLLGERAEAQSRAHFAAELARRSKAMERTAIGDKKRKASSLEPEGSDRKTSRQKVKGRPNDKLEAYKRDREQRDQQRQRRDDRRNGHRRSSSGDRDGGSDLDAEGESEVDWDEQVKQVSREEEPAELMHFEAVRVGRALFAKLWSAPGFEDVMTGTYVRVGAGQDAQRRTLYKMAKIIGFTTGRPYIFEGGNERWATDQYAIAQHGNVKKEYNFSYLSTGHFTETDFQTYKQSISENNGKLPTQTQLRKKFDDIHAFKNHFWDDKDINYQIEKRNKYRHMLVKASNSDAPKLLSKTEEESRRIAELNHRNRIAESQRVRNAQIEDRQRVKRETALAAREAARKKAEEAAKLKAEEEKAAARKANLDDLFEGDSRAGTPRGGTPRPGGEKKKEAKKGLPTFRKPKMDDDIIASMDLGINIEI